ncbi:MAG: radical SAM protein [Candidatus Heimdallarchaeota archaeon]|nr:radical SAM protein [Candidatus Heimdallarchaeota archaeon]
MIIEKYQAKSLIRTSRRSPHHIHLNIYQGCFHNCSYCDGKSDEYFMHDDYSNTIRAKINAPELLEEYLKNKGFLPINREKTNTLLDFIPQSSRKKMASDNPKFIINIFGNICDVYQPAEAELEITRKILQVAYDYGFPVRILTKNALVLRDIDLIKKINQDTFARVAFTITLSNPQEQLIFEPNASSTNERLTALKKLREEGIPAGVYITPVIPWIGDKDANLIELFQQLKDVKAEFVITGGLTLKPGRNKEDFLKTIDEHHPELLVLYDELYRNNSIYGQPDMEIWKKYKLQNPIKQGYQMSREFGINFYEPRYIPEGTIRINLEIATILSRIAFLMAEIYEESWHKAYELREAAIELENYPSDISLMKFEEILTLPFEKHVFRHIIEMLQTGKSSYLVKKEDNSQLFFKNDDLFSKNSSSLR